MNTFFGSDAVWKQIVRLSGQGGTKSAAVAFVSSDSVIKFGAGDLLIVDASDPVVQTGLTSASVLKRAISRGARVVSFPNLHSKVLVFPKAVVVGSANISLNSRHRLIEAVITSAEQSAVRDATKWIQALAGRGVPIDDSLLKHLMAIEGTRPRIRAAFRTLSEAHLVFFKEVKLGDIEKYNTQSSTAGTGGGARDLRVSPVSVFRGVLSQILSEPTSEVGVSYGKVLSHTAARGVQETIVELWRPTPSRPSELRISRFYDVPGWKISLKQFNQAQRAGRTLFYVLEMDIHGTVTAKVMSDTALGESDQSICTHIRNLVASQDGRRSIIGAVDILKGTTFP